MLAKFFGRHTKEEREGEVMAEKLKRAYVRIKKANLAQQRANMVEVYTSGSSLGVIRDMYGFKNTNTISGHIWAYHNEVRPLFAKGPGILQPSGRHEQLPKHYQAALKKFGPVPMAPVEEVVIEEAPDFLFGRSSPSGVLGDLTIQLLDLARDARLLAGRLVETAHKLEAVPNDSKAKALADIAATLAELKDAG